MVYLAYIDGSLKKEGLVVLEDLAERMCISRAEYDSAIANLSQYIIEPSISSEKRLKRIFDMFRVVFADRTINDKERRFVYRYALRLGFSKRNVRIVVDRSIAMFTGNFDFDAYINFIKR